MASVYIQQRKSLFPLSPKELLVAGLLLYAGEGAKSRPGEVKLSNTNPAIIRFFLHWLRRACGIPASKLKFKLHLYRDMDIAEEQLFWIHALGINREQLVKPYIKKSAKSRITYRGGFGHGTCNVHLNSVPLFERITMGIKVILDSAGA